MHLESCLANVLQKGTQVFWFAATTLHTTALTPNSMSKPRDSVLVAPEQSLVLKTWNDLHVEFAAHLHNQQSNRLWC